MNMFISITDFRKNLFSITDRLIKEGGEIVVEKEGQPAISVKKAFITPSQQAEEALKILPKLAGIWKNSKNLPDQEFFRGKKEIEYMKNLGKNFPKKIKWKKF